MGLTARQLAILIERFPGDAPVVVQAFDWNPKQQISVTTVIDANGASTPTNPMIVIFAGPPPTFSSYDNSGYQFPPNSFNSGD
jgi:hypothetical protein